MYYSKDIIENEKLPKWMSNHPIFKEVTTFRKVFPSKGLTNKSEPLAIFLAENNANSLISYIKRIAGSYIDYNKYNSYDDGVILKSICNDDSLIISKTNKISIKTTEDISSQKVFIPKNTSIFSVLDKLDNREIPEIILSSDLFKKFSRLNIPIGSANICFSTDPWDIATMSMRGIETCQSWNGGHRQCLIGSVLDPYVGMIYLSSSNKTTELGSKMLFRANVRFALERVFGPKSSPLIVIDQVYPEYFKEIYDLFAEYITNHSSLRVCDGSHLSHFYKDKRVFLPENSISEKLKYFSINGKSERPYIKPDSIESYQNNPIPTLYKKYKDTDTKDLKEKFGKFIFNNIDVSKIDISKFSYSSDKLACVAVLKNRCISDKYLISHVIKLIVNNLFDLFGNCSELEDKEVNRKLFFKFLLNRDKILNSISNGVNEWNSSFMLKGGSKFTKQEFVAIVRQFTQQVCQAAKEELRRTCVI